MVINKMGMGLGPLISLLFPGYRSTDLNQWQSVRCFLTAQASPRQAPEGPFGGVSFPAPGDLPGKRAVLINAAPLSCINLVYESICRLSRQEGYGIKPLFRGDFGEY